MSEERHSLAILVATAAANASGVPFETVTVSAEQDALNEPAYFFTYVVTAKADEVTGETWIGLSRELRERLLALGDTRYPYVRLTSR